MGIAGHELTDTLLRYTSTSGVVFTLTKVQIQDFYATTSGNAASRRQQVIDWVKGQIVAALPNDISLDTVLFDIDTALTITALGTTRGS